MATQWRTQGGMAGLVWLGLDYGPLNTVQARLAFEPLPEQPVPTDSELFYQLQCIERAALASLNEK